MRIVNGRIEIRVRKVPRPFPERVHAVTVWPLIFYEPQVWDDACVQRHERYHWLDQIRWLVLPWLAVYLLLLPLYGGGRKHPLERKAYRLQELCEQAPPAGNRGPGD